VSLKQEQVEEMKAEFFTAMILRYSPIFVDCSWILAEPWLNSVTLTPNSFPTSGYLSRCGRRIRGSSWAVSDFETAEVVANKKKMPRVSHQNLKPANRSSIEPRWHRRKSFIYR